MAGEVLEMAIAQTKEILNGEFSVELTITPTGEDAVVILGIAPMHSQIFNQDGLPSTGDNVHCTFYEKDLNDLGVTTRDLKGNCNIQDWKVSWINAISQTVVCKFGDLYPDLSLGLIRVQLVAYE